MLNQTNIPFIKYIDIRSFVANAQPVTNRDYITRVFTTNPLLPTESYIEFTNLASVGAYFGTASEEYKRASFYFNFVSKTFRSPQKISFARWTNADVAALIFGTRVSATPLSTFQAINNGAISLTIAGTTHIVEAIDFSAITSFSNVASVLQLAINAFLGTQFADATVAFNSTSGGFNFTSGATGVATISAALAGTGTEILNLLGWGNGAIFSNGDAAQTITSTLDASANASNNFSTYLFMPALTEAQVAESALWLKNYDPNVSFMYLVPVTTANYTSYLSTLVDVVGANTDGTPSAPGTIFVISQIAGEYKEMLPGAINASTDYNGVNSVPSYMFYQADLTPDVLDAATAALLDAARINYYGRTQTAGQQLAFLQDGVIFSSATSPTDINTYANEIWLKDAQNVSYMSAFLILQKVSADAEGIATILGLLQQVVDSAKLNGSISTGKTLTAAQKSAITQLTGDANAWQQVQTNGYWKGCTVSTYTSGDGSTKYKASPTLIYSKDDDIRKVEGTDILI